MATDDATNEFNRDLMKSFKDAEFTPAVQRAAERVRYIDARELVKKQAEDAGLWFVAKTASEAYLQQELRRLHAAIEGLTSEEWALDTLARLTGEAYEPNRISEDYRNEPIKKATAVFPDQKERLQPDISEPKSRPQADRLIFEDEWERAVRANSKPKKRWWQF